MIVVKLQIAFKHFKRVLVVCVCGGEISRIEP